MGIVLDTKQQIVNSKSPDTVSFNGGLILPDESGAGWFLPSKAISQLGTNRNFAVGTIALAPGEPEQVVFVFETTDSLGGFEQVEALHKARITYINPLHPAANALFQVGDAVTVTCFKQVNTVGLQTVVRKATPS